jgi:Integrin alpha
LICIPGFNVTFKLDKRIRFTNSTNNDEFVVSVEKPLCKTYLLSAIITNLLPISVEMEFKLKDVAPQGGPFCENCFVTTSTKVKKSLLPIRTMCKTTICNTELQILTKTNTTNNLVLGETKTLEISYEIKNTGETSYLTTLWVSGLDGVILMKSTPSQCKMDKNVTCTIGPMGTLTQKDSVSLDNPIDFSL